MRYAIVLAAVLLAVSATPAAASQRPSPGAASVDDRLFPGLGNGGYDVLHYHLDLRYATSAPTQPIDGKVTIVARATQALSRFNLDFAGASVADVTVDGRAASWTRSGEELVVTPSRALRDHKVFVVRARFTAVPTPADVSVAFFVNPDGSAMSAQPDLAHDIFPSNDHPSDKATFSFALDVPAGTVAVANGVRTEQRTRGGRTTSVYVMRQPMATQLIQVAMGNYDVTWRGVHRGIPVRDLTAPSLTAFLEPKLALVLGHIDWTLEQFGRYPFDMYGSFVVNEEIGFALETQTLSIYDPRFFTSRPQGLWDPVMVHELTHQWFGDDVSVLEWSDLWLSEGHATWYEALYAEERGFMVQDTGYATFDEWMKATYALGDQWRALYGPVARPVAAETLFSDNVYPGGALVLYALRQKIGQRAFDRVEHEWLRRYEGESASTDDFIALASKVSGRDLRSFLRAWVYGTTTPPMPGHPDWTVLPVTQASAAARAPTARSGLGSVR